MAGALIAVAGAAAAGCGSPPTTAQQTQTAAAATPASATVAATPAPVTPASTGPLATLAPATPAAVQPLASGATGARTDCPAGWGTYASAGGKVTLCAPVDFTGTASVDQGGAPGIMVSSGDARRVPRAAVPGVLVAVGLSAHPALNPTLPLATVCASGGHPNGVTAFLTLGSLAASGCRWVQEANSALDGPLESLLLVATVSGGGFVEADVNWRTQSPGAHDLAIQVASTLRVAP